MSQQKKVSLYQPPRILVVDDKLQNRLLFREYLDEMNLEIDEASSGRECLEKLKENQYTLICLDVQMPVMDGFEVLEKIRRNKDLATIPVIFISAILNSEKYILRGIELGAIDFIPKPLNIAILRSKISNVIRLYENQLKLDAMLKKLGDANQRLKENELKFKRITQSASDAIILLDQNFGIRFWNRSALKVFGYSRYEVASENFLEVMIAEKERKKLRESFKELDTSGNTTSETIEVRGMNKEDEEFPLELSLGLFQTANKKINYVVIARDITQRLRMEREAIAARELRLSNKIMKEFMDNVSHELRTPMNAILGISKMLLKYDSENLTSKQEEGLQIIQQSGERLLDMINDVLDLSRIESKKEKVVTETFQLDRLLASINSIALSLIGKKPLKFSIKKSSTIPESLLSDPQKIQQILINLISNAVKFTARGKIQLFIHLVDDKLYFEVTDTGIGIEEKNLEKIFKRFHQIDSTASKEYKGTGLGLNIVKNLVEMMNGEIRAESIPGSGTTMKFYIRIQFAEGIKVPIPKDTKASYEIWPSRKEGKSKLALIIDDKKAQHFQIAGILGESGFRSVSCYRSRDALTAAEHFDPDLIVLNMEMPKTHGYTLLNHLKKNFSASVPPVLAITSIRAIQKSPAGLKMSWIHTPVSESAIMEAMDRLPVKRKIRRKTDLLIFPEKVFHSKSIDKTQSMVHVLDSSASGLIILERHRVKNLVLYGMDLHGENIKLCRELAKRSVKPYEKLYIIYNQTFKAILDEVSQLLPDHRELSLSGYSTNVSIKEMIEADKLVK